MRRWLPCLDQDGEGAGAAADVEDALARLRSDLVEERAPPHPFPGERTNDSVIKWREHSPAERGNELAF